MSSDGEPLAVITGPTGVGKTHFAVLLAERVGAEIVSADSRQVYRGLSIGTAKPGPEVLRRVPHHVIDVCDPTEQYNLARFIADAEAALDSIRSRGKVPIVVGGTGLYIKGLIEGIFETNAEYGEVREELEDRLRREGVEMLYDELRRVDSQAAARIHPNDWVRIIRALEVFRSTGIPISRLQWQSREHGPRYTARVAILTRPRSELYHIINARTEAMFCGGLLEELGSVLARGVPPDAPGLRTIGYRQALAYRRGEITLDEAISEAAKQTRRYAKRQMTWFRAMTDAVWIDVSSQDDEKIIAHLEKTLAIA